MNFTAPQMSGKIVTATMESHITNLESLLARMEDMMHEADYKDVTFTKLRKRKNDKEEKLFVAKINNLMRHLIEFKADRSLVHIFHLRFIHSCTPIRRQRLAKIIAQLTEYLRIINKESPLIVSNPNSSNSSLGGQTSSGPIYEMSGSITSTGTSNSTNSPNSVPSSAQGHDSSVMENLTLAGLSMSLHSNGASANPSPMHMSPNLAASPPSAAYFVKEAPEVKMARELYDYLTSHRTDPDNSLIGCELSSSFIDGLFKFRSQHSYNKRSLVRMIKSWGALKDESLIKEVRKMSATLNGLDFKRGELVVVDLGNDGIGGGSGINNSNNGSGNGGADDDDYVFDIDDEPATTVAPTSNKPHNTSNISINSNNNNNNNNNNHSNISITNKSNSSLSHALDESIELSNRPNVYKFARFDDEHLSRSCKIFTIPTEDAKTSTTIVNSSNVYKLSPEIVEQIRSEKNIVKLIVDPSIPFNLSLAQRENDLLYRYLESKGVEISIFERCRSNQTSFAEMPAIKNCRRVMGQLENNLSQLPLLTQAIQFAKQESKPFLETTRKTCFYIPLLMQMEEMAKNIEADREKKIRTRIQQLMTYVDLNLQKLMEEKKEILEGSANNKLSQWWMAISREEVESFLLKRQFDFNAVPQDYMEKPPQNMAAVRFNLDLLHDILTPNGGGQTKSSVQFSKTVVEKLVRDVYPKIELFVVKCKLVVLDCIGAFDVSLAELEANGMLDMDRLRQLYLMHKQNLERQKCSHIDRIFKDIEYLLDMRRLEDTTSPTEKRLDIVTISGITFGRLHRLENEMRTVVELWKHLETSPSSSSPPVLHTKNSFLNYISKSTPQLPTMISGGSHASEQQSTAPQKPLPPTPKKGSKEDKRWNEPLKPIARLPQLLNQQRTKTQPLQHLNRSELSHSSGSLPTAASIFNLQRDMSNSSTKSSSSDSAFSEDAQEQFQSDM
ncbi:hypothetical protein SAMD00019534_036580 [Acytostelium subglobosum LB1]|uniref:hypothetical protein n=1 Tax=Acytostelium subglobosum LB1 TaxID=1410327 RepID=UPI000644C48C|nr:hypothetical protein SAMD00019534_036580 [Acytostelium subglobosum LB1]GAM20483.1 hypothetical protein SAMD00019534_036580 [Acytostelium subglobosum LB1]|eukprot:XP_012760004.1 hypothetical protein SAMD00019534_036580 [Acytostelium subglobosum LB1]